MSRQLEALAEQRITRRHQAIIEAVEYKLVASVGDAGGALDGLAYKDRGGDCLLVIKAELAGRRQVAFVGAEDLGSLLIKATKLASSDQLVWRDDEYST